MLAPAALGFPEGTTLATVSSGGRRKCHFTLPGDSGELIEEYDLQTDELLVRKRRCAQRERCERARVTTP